MFDNILYQSATDLLKKDLVHNSLPSSMLFYGAKGSGKLSAALELARLVSCQKKGEWECDCASCNKHKALLSQNVILLGGSNRQLEIRACANTFLTESINNSSHLEASRLLFLRSVRKLTMRFESVLWEGEDKVSKFSPLFESINEDLEKIDPSRPLPDHNELNEIVESLKDNCAKLEKSFLYETIPVNLIRNFSVWARQKSSSGKKVVIIQNAEKMQESARNALLKILEEPPSDVIFILTTSVRSAILPTILSRVRTYNFVERNVKQQQEVIDRVYHYVPGFGKEMPESIERFLELFLSISRETIDFYAGEFFTEISKGKIPDIQKICSSLSNFDPRLLFKIFLECIVAKQRSLLAFEGGAEASKCILKELQKSYSNVTTYNQNPQSALEELTRNLMQVNYTHEGILKEVFAGE